MSTESHTAIPLQWDLTDRLNKSLRASHITVQQMAEYLGVHRNTVGAWLNGRTPPSTQTLRLWALRTGAPYEWLCDGDGSPPPPPGQGLPATSVEGQSKPVGLDRQGLRPAAHAA